MQLAHGFSITGEILRSHWISAYEFSVDRDTSKTYKTACLQIRTELDKNMLYLMTVGYFLCFTCIPTSNIHEINGIKIIAAISIHGDFELEADRCSMCQLSVILNCFPCSRAINHCLIPPLLPSEIYNSADMSII